MSRKVAEWLRLSDDDTKDTLGLVLPVYGWRVPKAMRKTIVDCRKDIDKDTFIWAVFTCGDDVGMIDRDLERLLGRKLDAAYSVVMPDTYLGLPGFRLDSKEESDHKLTSAKSRCETIRNKILAKERVRDLKRGCFPWLKTEAIGRFFNRFIVTDRLWKVDREKCLKCGVCARDCPTGDIKLDAEGFPSWKHDGSCTGCFRCYHFCKGDAIEFGRFTKGKGRLTSMRAIVSLGSNIEPRAKYLQQAIERLSAMPRTRLTHASTIIETDPIEVPAQFADQKFLNQIAVFETGLEVHEFSRRMHEIEDALGRVRTIRNGPRTIDIDLIDFGGLHIDEPTLTLPHPRAHERSFVMKPMQELGIADALNDMV